MTDCLATLAGHVSRVKIEVTHVEYLAYNYKNDTWYSRQEMKGFKRRPAHFLLHMSCANMSLAEFAVQTIKLGQDSSIFMGLECYLTNEATRNVSKRKEVIRRTIIQEQTRQVDLGIYDPDRMSLISKSSSEVSAQRARIIGLLHAS